jgi:hypothetical protein
MTLLVSPPGILSFPSLFVPRPPVPGAEPRYSCTIIFDEAAQKHEKYLALKRAVLEAIEDEWGSAKAKDQAFLKKLRLPFRDAGEKSYSGYGPGKTFIQPWTKQKPGVVDANKADVLVPTDVFAGQLVRVAVSPFTYQQSGNMGVSFSLEHVQILAADMPRLDGRKSAKDTFDDDADVPALADADVPF